MAALAIQQVVESLRSTGLKLAVTPDLGLKVTPASILTAEMRDLIRTCKQGLIDCLSNAANDPAHDPDSTQVDLQPPDKPDDPAHWRELAAAYYAHHFKCSICIAAGQSGGRGSRCDIGKDLWKMYDETHSKDSLSASKKTDRE